MSDAPAGLLPDLICGGAVMRLPVRRIAVLIRVEILFRVGRNNLMHPPDGPVRSFVTRSDDQLSAQSSEDPFALVGRAVRQAKFHRIAKRSPNRGVGDSRIAAGGIDDGLAEAQCAAILTSLNHAQRRPILDRASRIEPLGLGVEFHIGKLAADSRQAQERRVANQLEHRLSRPAPGLFYPDRGCSVSSSSAVGGGHALESCSNLPNMRPVYSELDAARQFDGIACL